MRRKSWFRLSFCQRLTTATLCWRVFPKTGWIACREYKTMQLVWSLADEGEAMQSLWLCSDRSTGCQSELGLSTRFPSCAILLVWSSHYQPSRSPRCADAGLKIVSRIKLNKYGKRVILSIGPVAWNSVPKSVRDASSLSSNSSLKRFLLKIKINI